MPTINQVRVTQMGDMPEHYYIEQWVICRWHTEGSARHYAWWLRAKADSLELATKIADFIRTNPTNHSYTGDDL